MTNNEFKQVLLDNSQVMSKQELEEIIENELLKSESEMDADLIEYCLDNIKKLELSEESNKKEESKKVFFINPKMWRVLVAMSVVFVFAITASAFYFNIPEEIAQLINGNAELDVNLENADTTADGYALLETNLAKELESFGITPVTFPEAMVRKECKISKVENLTVDETISIDAHIVFENSNFKGEFFVSQFKNDLEWSGSDTVMSVKAGELINVNGIDVLVFEQNKSCTITYKDNSTEYNILLECDFELAKEFAKTIR
jgi:hypothetical protein